ncbi:MAG TPA: S1/P1 nuclease [Chthoniobacterales bacterium]|nr:S1/P1 nuclease [Chthoniobacterales bacterium]
MNRLRALVFVSLGFCTRSALAYGPTGHEIVGGISDKLLANTLAGAQVSSLLDGMTLEKAAVIADEIKAWDKDGADDANAFPHYPDHPKIDKQLREFWRANQPTPDRASQVPSHHWFHYTDVPVLNAQKYADGRTGRSQWDIVHMIPYCVDVVRGEVSENNPRKITKSVALILLAHYVADIHQPLHVGAAYFDQTGRAVDPDRSKTALEDEGGNTIMLRLSHGTAQELAKRGLKLHGFWDNEAVLANLGPISPAVPKEAKFQAVDKPKRALIDQLMHQQPAGWQLPSNFPLAHYAEAWADEILPLAREAHERLRFINVHPQLDEDRTVAAGTALEKTARDRASYADWAAAVVRQELHKAGWRLADLLSQALTSTSLEPSRR